MEGYTPAPQVYRLKFPKRDGLVVDMSSVTVEESVEMSVLISLIRDGRSALRLLQIFADHLIEWNVRDKQGKPVGTDIASVRATDGPFVYEVLFNWWNALTGVDEGKDESSDDTQDPPEASLPMTAL